MTAQLVLCGEASPFEGGEACPLEQGHDGAHVYWRQTRPESKRARNGVYIVDARGELLLHATFMGAVTAEDICALLAIRDLVKDRA